MSKHTVVSILNYETAPEFKPGLLPISYFQIPHANGSEVGVLVVEDGFYNQPLPGTSTAQRDMRSVKIPESSQVIADAIVNDYCSAQLCLGPDQGPGLFYVEGEWEAEDIPKKFKSELRQAKIRHTNWCRGLVKMADDLWAVHKQHRHISATMIQAADYLGLSREWTQMPSPDEFIECKGCGTRLKNFVAVCHACNCIIDPERYSALQFA